MKQIIYKPEKDFEGEIVIGLPSVRQRMMYFKEISTSLDARGKLKANKEKDSLKLMQKSFDILEKHIVSVDIKHIESGQEFKSFNDMADDSLCDELILTNCIGVIVHGEVGEPSR